MIAMKYLLLIIIAAAVASCSSPLDVKTPRQKDLDSLKAPTKVNVVEMDLTISSDNAITQYQFTTSGSAAIDTADAHPALWLNFTGTAPAGSEGSIALRSLLLHFDSLRFGNAQISIVNGPTDKAGGDMVMEMTPGSPTHCIPDGSTRTLVMTFTLDKSTRTLSATFAADPSPGGRAYPLSGTLTLRY
jgi:hypothetical protein